MAKMLIKMTYLLKIKSGAKTAEGRANYPNLRNIKKGDDMTFMSGCEIVSSKVDRVSLYNSVNEMLDNEDVNALIPGVTKEEARDIYNSIYPPEKVKINKGMRVFGLKLK